MGYDRQNFKNGQVLTAACLNRMEDGICNSLDKQQGTENAGKVLGIGEDGLVKPVEQTGGGAGNNGATFIPSVDKDGFISWTNDSDLPNPEPVNIRGPVGESGPQGDPGYTPQRGVDYWTEDDKQDIVSDVLDALPAAEEASF